jgi:hypothetical protein
VASLALFLVVAGGSALAAGQLGKNSVGSKQLKKNAVTAAKIKNNAVTTAKIENGAVTGSKIKTSTLGTVPNADNAATLGGQAAGAFQQRVRWAFVEKDGTIISQSGGITVTHNPVGCTPGCYFLNFGSSQTGKAITLSSGSPEFALFIDGVCGGEGPGRTECTTGTSENVNDANHILVLSASTSSEALSDRGFYITVTG